jgi:putative transposase
MRPSTHSVNADGELFDNIVVVQDIEQTLTQEFCCYGYRNMTGELKEKVWIINPKKVYRLMKEYRLLYGSRIRPEPLKRNFIRFRSLQPDRPLQYLSMDIKYVHVHGGRNALLLTVMDIYSHKVLIHMMRRSIKKGDVLVLLSLMLLEYKSEAMTLRNDNGSQFIANAVRQYLKDKDIPDMFNIHNHVRAKFVFRYHFHSI